MNDTLQGYFQLVDDMLEKLARSDSTIEYAPHVRPHFDNMVSSLNDIRLYLGGDEKKSHSYFNDPETVYVLSFNDSEFVSSYDLSDKEVVVVDDPYNAEHFDSKDSAYQVAAWLGCSIKELLIDV